MNLLAIVVRMKNKSQVYGLSNFRIMFFFMLAWLFNLDFDIYFLLTRHLTSMNMFLNVSRLVLVWGLGMLEIEYDLYICI